MHQSGQTRSDKADGIKHHEMQNKTKIQLLRQPLTKQADLGAFGHTSQRADLV